MSTSLKSPLESNLVWAGANSVFLLASLLWLVFDVSPLYRLAALCFVASLSIELYRIMDFSNVSPPKDRI